MHFALLVFITALIFSAINVRSRQSCVALKIELHALIIKNYFFFQMPTSQKNYTMRIILPFSLSFMTDYFFSLLQYVYAIHVESGLRKEREKIAHVEAFEKKRAFSIAISQLEINQWLIYHQ